MNSFNAPVLKGAEVEEDTIDLCNKVIQSVQQGATAISGARAMTLAVRLKEAHMHLARFRQQVLDWAEQTEAGSEAQAGGGRSRTMDGG